MKAYFIDKTFNYDFPEGILEIYGQGSILPLVTESSDEVFGEILIKEGLAGREGFSLIKTSNFHVQEGESLFVLSHFEFTLICDNHKGDIEGFDFWPLQSTVPSLEAGWYKADIYCKVDPETQEIYCIYVLNKSEVDLGFVQHTEVAAV